MIDRPLRIVFAGTPPFAALHLEALLNSPDTEVIAVYTQPDRPAGRGKKLAPSAVKELALRHNLPVYQPLSLRNDQAQAELQALDADVMVGVAYGLILPQAVLDTPRLGCINVHASILPRWRGAAPIQRAIQAGDRETGVTIMQMDAGLDTGAMLTIARCPIVADETAATLHDRLAAIGAPALLSTLQALANDTAQPVPQDDSQTCYAAKIDKAEAAIDWQKPAIELDRLIRAFNPAPMAYAELHGERIKIHRAQPSGSTAAAPGTLVEVTREAFTVACGSNTSLQLTLLQLPGGKPLNCAELLNGRAELFSAGQRFDHG